MADTSVGVSLYRLYGLCGMYGMYGLGRLGNTWRVESEEIS